MNSNAVFFLSPHCTVQISSEAGINALIEGLKRYASISLRSHNGQVTLIDGDKQWLMVETSGTSGAPKTIRRSPQSWISSFDVTHRLYDVSSMDTYATLGSLAHSLTLYATLEALHLGADLCALSASGPRRQAEQIKENNVTVLYATPSQLRLLVKGASGPFGDMRYIFSGGGKLDQGLRNALKSLCPNAHVIEFFGASETSFVTIADPKTPNGSVGRAYPDVTLRIGKAASSGVDDIWIKSPYLFDGYQTGTSQDTVWDGDYLNIGDVGYLDENGYLFLKGRKSRMVTIADKNVFPEEIEQVISQMKGIETCAILAQPDTLRGHKLTCFVEANDTMTVEMLRDHCRSALNSHAVPREIFIIAKMPYLAAGKPDLHKLQAMLHD